MTLIGVIFNWKASLMGVILGVKVSSTRLTPCRTCEISLLDQLTPEFSRPVDPGCLRRTEVPNLGGEYAYEGDPYRRHL